jgi:predicted nucleic acid-binding protein
MAPVTTYLLFLKSAACRVVQAKAVGDVGISSITLAELRFGVSKSAQRQQNQAALDQFLLPLDIAAFDELAADSYGDVRAELESNGTPIGPLDTLIAGHGLSLNVVLVTHNVNSDELRACELTTGGRLHEGGALAVNHPTFSRDVQ